MKRFIVWLFPIVILLAGIPLLLIYNVSSLAKIFGIVVVVLTTLAIRYWMFRSKNQKVYGDRIKLTVNEHFFLKEHIPFYTRMGIQTRKTFEECVCQLLSDVSFDNFDHTEAAKDACLSFASVVALINSQSNISLWKETVVVFWDKEGIESSLQGLNEVIFLNEGVLLTCLKEFRSPESQLVLPSEYQHLLIKQR